MSKATIYCICADCKDATDVLPAEGSRVQYGVVYRANPSNVDCGLATIGALTYVTTYRKQMEDFLKTQKMALVGTTSENAMYGVNKDAVTKTLKELGFTPLTQYKGNHGDYKMTVWIWVPPGKQTKVDEHFVQPSNTKAKKEGLIASIKRGSNGRFVAKKARG